MITLSSLRDQVRQRADMQNSLFVTNSELDGYINNSYLELYDIIVSRFEDYYSEQELFTISTGNSQPIPEDFYKLRGLDYDLNGTWVEVRNKYRQPDNILWQAQYRRYRVMAGNILIIPEDNATGNYRLWYIPKAQRMVVGVLGTLTIQDILYTAVDVYSDGNLISIQYSDTGSAGFEVVNVVGNAIEVEMESGVSTAAQILTAIQNSVAASALVTAAISGTASTAQTAVSATFLTGSVVQIDMDEINGFEEYIIIDAAIKCLIKEESDVSVLLAQKQQIMQRIEAMASNRDAGEPERVTDVYDYGWGYEW